MELRSSIQNYALINVLCGPDGKKNDEHGVKIKAVFETLYEAKEYGDHLKETDATFDFYIVEMVPYSAFRRRQPR